jgi:hypothetical protein
MKMSPSTFRIIRVQERSPVPLVKVYLNGNMKSENHQVQSKNN